MTNCEVAGVCTGPFKNRELTSNFGRPTITINNSGLIFNCNYKVGTKCKAFRRSPTEPLPKCKVWEFLSNVRTGTKEGENIPIEIETVQGRLVYDEQAHEVLTSPFLPPDHNPVPLTPKDGSILGTLMRDQGRIATFSELKRKMNSDDILNVSVTIYISRIRRKIGEDRNSKSIFENINDVGYRIQKPKRNLKEI
jgi:DNA-binding winged helix-turn-helix (wHTH) protein